MQETRDNRANRKIELNLEHSGESFGTIRSVEYLLNSFTKEILPVHQNRSDDCKYTVPAELT